MKKPRTDLAWLRQPALVRAVAVYVDSVGGFDMTDPDGSCLALGVHPDEREQFLALVTIADAARPQTGNAARCRRARQKKAEEEARRGMSPPMSQGMSGPMSETMSQGVSDPVSPPIRLASSPSFHSVSGSSSSSVSAENTFQSARARAGKMPVDLALTTEARAAAEMVGLMSHGHVGDDIALEWVKFRAHYVETGESSPDWYQRWQKWAAKAVQLRRSENHGSGPRASAFASEVQNSGKKPTFIGALADEELL